MMSNIKSSDGHLSASKKVTDLFKQIDLSPFRANQLPALELKLHEELIIAPRHFGEGASVVVNKSEDSLLDSLNIGISKLGNLRL